jgi:diguanylate cyclase (GGDEF)-like protein
MRQAALLGGPLLAALLAADAALDLVRGDGQASDATILAVVEIAAVLLGVVAVRRRIPAEPVALAVLLVIYGATVLRTSYMTSDPGLSLAYVTLLLVASGLFLPWRPIWHLSWIGAAVVLTMVGAMVGTLGTADEAFSTLIAVAMASVASGLGQAIAHLRLRRGLEQQFEFRRLSEHAQRQGHEVVALNTELVRTARIDPVTGLGNRRALDEALKALAGQRIAAVLLDLDHFKAFNDRFGHLAGDAALARFGELLQATVREGDLAFRYGGEEFLVLVPGGEAEGAARLGERIRAAVHDDETTGRQGLTVSAGVAAADRFSSADPLPLLRRADVALYQAKRHGRDRVVMHHAGEAA